MKQTNYTELADIISASIETISAKQISFGYIDIDAAHYTIGVLKSLLAQTLLDVPEYKQAHILKVLTRL